MAYIRAKNVGVGFIVAEDYQKITIKELGGDINEVTGDYAEWLTRVGGELLSDEAALTILTGEQLNAQRADAIAKIIEVSMVQAELALLQADLLDDVEAGVATLDRAVQIEWKRRLTVKRDHPLVLALQVAKDWSDAQMDDLFVPAAGL